MTSTPARLLLLAAALLAAPLPAAAQAFEPIPNAGDWKMQTPLPGVPYTACIARADGPQAATILSTDTTGTPVLALARSDGASLTGEPTVTLSIDGAPPEPIAAAFAHNQLQAPLDDPTRLARLRTARTLDWTLPTGRLHADVTGLGRALDAVLACRSDGPLTAQ